MNKHTPGPWGYHNIEGQKLFSIESSTMEYVAESNYHFNGTEHPGYRERAEADARLISAAPDLLHALSRAIHQTVITADPDSLYQICRRAIDKAEGR